MGVWTQGTVFWYKEGLGRWEVFSLMSVSGLPKSSFMRVLGWLILVQQWSALGKSLPQLNLPARVQGCCRGRRNMLGRCSSSHALMNWAFCTRSLGPQALGEVRRDAKLPCPRRRKLNVSLRAILCDPLSTFWFCISMIPLHNKPGKNKTP